MSKGIVDYRRFKKGEALTRNAAIRAMCYMCNGLDGDGTDCGCEESCPLHQYMPYNVMSKPKRKLSKKQMEKMKEGRKKVG